MQAHIMSFKTHTFGPWVGIKRSKHFVYESSHAGYRIKGMKLRAPCQHILFPYLHPQSVGRVKR